MNKRKSEFRAWCAVCGGEFKAAKKSALYCGSACKQAAYRYRNGKETPKRYGKSVSKKTAGKPFSKPKLKTCPHCGKRFSVQRKDAKFCSASCRTVANRNKQSRTASKLERETGIKFGDVFFEASKTSWAAQYAKLEALGFVYIESSQLWVTPKSLSHMLWGDENEQHTA